MIKNAFNSTPDDLFVKTSKERSVTPRQSLSTGEISLCEVHDVLAYGHSYIVKANNGPRMIASLGSSSAAMLPIGARDLSMLTPGTIVAVWCCPQFVPVILCAIASPQGSNRTGLPDIITPSGNAGMFFDPAHQFVAANEHGQGFIDYSAGRPLDNVPGDWGMLNELGVGFFLGKLLASMKASDLCRLDMFYPDDLARLFAYNWQHYTAGSSTEAFDDEGEWTSIEDFNPFTDEMRGGIEETPADDLSVFKKNFGLEPENSLQTPKVRMRTFRGFLGDLKRTMVYVPILGVKPVFGTDKDDDEGKYPKDVDITYTGLLDEVYGIDGSYSLRAAKSIILEKTSWIPTPDMLMPRDHPDGDTNFENTAGAGEVLPEFPGTGDSAEDSVRRDDRDAYWWTRYIPQGFRLRKKDWKISDDPELASGGKVEQKSLVPYSSFSQPSPGSSTKSVSPSKTATFHQGKAGVYLLDDGGIELRDAFGSSIKLLGGNIEISCAGSVINRSGKDVQTWAGKNVIIKANNDVEISSANRDVRIKAERNLMALGGNSGQGGVLIESRSSAAPDFTGGTASTNVGGLTLKSSRGKLDILGNGVHIRSEKSGLVLDGEGGEQDVTLFGRNLQKYLRNGATEVISNRENMETTPQDEVSVITHSRSLYSLATGSIKLAGNSLTMVNHRGTNTNMNVNLKGNITVEGRGSATLDFSKIQGPLNLGNEAQIQNTIIDTVLSSQVGVSSELFLRDATSLPITSVNMGFFFPGTGELQLNSMIIYEAPWQKMIRESLKIKQDEDVGSKVNVAEEQEVFPRIDKATLQGSGDPTMAFPGFKAWTHKSFDRTQDEVNDSALGRYDDKFVDHGAEGNRPKPVGEDITESYDLSLIESSNKGKFEGNYIINT